MSNDYGNDAESSNGAAEADTLEVFNEYLKSVDKKDLRDALFFVMGIRSGTESNNK